MFRKLMAVVLGFLLTLAVSVADEVKGKVKSVDSDKGTITLTVGDKDQVITVAKTAEIFSLGKAKKGQAAPKLAVPGGLSGLQVGSEVTLTTDKDTATTVQVLGAAKKKKKN